MHIIREAQLSHIFLTSWAIFLLDVLRGKYITNTKSMTQVAILTLTILYL